MKKSQVLFHKTVPSITNWGKVLLTCLIINGLPPLLPPGASAQGLDKQKFRGKIGKMLNTQKTTVPQNFYRRDGTVNIDALPIAKSWLYQRYKGPKPGANNQEWFANREGREGFLTLDRLNIINGYICRTLYEELNKAWKTPYEYGGKVLGEKFDCSGFVSDTYRRTIDRLIKEHNMPTNLREIGPLLCCGSANQIKNIAQRYGKLDDNDIRNGYFPAATIIGVIKPGETEISHVGLCAFAKDKNTDRLILAIWEFRTTGEVGPHVEEVSKWTKRRLDDGCQLIGVNPFFSVGLPVKAGMDFTKNLTKDGMMSSSHQKQASWNQKEQIVFGSRYDLAYRRGKNYFKTFTPRV